MAIEKILNKRSNAVVTDGGVDSPKKPTSSQLDNGEIAVNYHKGTERMFMKNDNDEVVEFVSKDEVDKKQDKVNGVNIVRKEFEDESGTYTEGVVEVDNGVYNAMVRKDEIVFTYDSDKGSIIFSPIAHTIHGKYFPGGVKCKHKKTDDPLENDLRIARMCDLPSQVQSNWNETDTTSKAYILNKPNIPTKTSDLNNDSKFVSEDDIEGEKVQKTETLNIESDGAVLDSESKLVSDDNSDFYVKPASGTTATLETRGGITNDYYVNIKNNLVREKQELCRIHIPSTGTLNGRFSVTNMGAADAKVDVEYTNSNNELVTISQSIDNYRSYGWASMGGSDSPIDVKGNTSIIVYVTLNSSNRYLNVDFHTDILQLVVTESKYVIPTRTYIVEHTTEETTIDALTPNVLHKWGTMASLTISALATPSDETIVNEYMIEFTSGSTATVLSLPRSIVWAETPNIEANATYQISVINNLGIIVKFS